MIVPNADPIRRGLPPIRGGLFWLLLATLIGATAAARAQPPVDAPGEDPEAAYTRVIHQRADRIVAQLGIDDAAQATRVRDLIAAQYRNLREIHDARDAQLAAVKQDTRGAGRIREAANLQQFALHRTFLAQLATELTAAQIDQVKDGLTYGVLPATYHQYLELLPDLTPELKKRIRAHLIEAREYAMDAGSSEEKHGWFRKYKGRINNNLSAAGYDLKQAEQQWRKRR